MVSGTTEVLEIRSENPSLHVLIVPGNPGVVSIACYHAFILFYFFSVLIYNFILCGIAGVITFYKDFVEFLYELLEGSASITGK